MTGWRRGLSTTDWRAGARTVHRFSILIIVLHAALSALGSEGLVAAIAVVVLLPATVLVHPFTAGMVPLLVVCLATGILAGAPRTAARTHSPDPAEVA